MSYSSTGVCLGCEEGKNFLVTSCPNVSVSGCLSELAGICTVCSDQKTPASDGKSCTDTKCSDANCDACSVVGGAQLCAKCKSGYALDLSTAKCAAEKTANCAT